MAINEIQTRGILQKSGIPGISYVLNPYTGCTHGCVYCYARFMRRFTGHTEPWGQFLDVKVNAPEVLRKTLQRRKTPLSEGVFLSSVTDLYQPAEAKYQLTRRILEVLLEFQVPVDILTKSDLVLRDLDLLQQFTHCHVGLSLMTTDDDLARRMEPFATPPTRRLQALHTLCTAGLTTYAFISPYVPSLSNLEHIVTALAGKVSEIGVEALNIKAGNWSGVAATLAQYYPAQLALCQQHVKDAAYWDVLEQQTRELAAQQQMAFMGFFRH
jgi:DNA repair photolyase